MDKKKVGFIFDSITTHIENMPPAEVFETLGTTMGLVAMVLERANGTDRAVTFKMIQRHGYAAMKELERADKERKQ